jgi:tetratricopeptide (TPR) repeat protein
MREGVEWLRRFLDRIDAIPPEVVVPALLALGNLSLDLGEYGDASDAFSGNPRLVATAHNGLGMVAWYRGDMECARSHHERSLAIRQAIGDRHGEANSYSNLGNVLKDGGDTTRARELHLQAWRIRSEMGNAGAAGYSSLNLGDVARRTGDVVTARGYFEQSLAAFHAVNDRLGTAYAQQGLGLTAQLAGDTHEASRRFVEAIVIRQQHGDRRGVVECIEGIASTATSVGRHEEAARLFGAAATLREAFQARLPDPDRALYDRSISSLRRALVNGAFASAWDEGASMSLPPRTLQEGSVRARSRCSSTSPPDLPTRRLPTGST